MNNNDTDQALAPVYVAYKYDLNQLTQTHLLPVPKTPTTVEVYTNVSTKDAYVTTTVMCLPGTEPTPAKSTDEAEVTYLQSTGPTNADSVSKTRKRARRTSTDTASG